MISPIDFIYYIIIWIEWSYDEEWAILIFLCGERFAIFFNVEVTLHTPSSFNIYRYSIG